MTDFLMLLTSLGFKLATALTAFTVALVFEAYLERRLGNFHRNLLHADPEAKAIYLGARRLAVALLVGLAVS